VILLNQVSAFKLKIDQFCVEKISLLLLFIVYSINNEKTYFCYVIFVSSIIMCFSLNHANLLL